ALQTNFFRNTHSGRIEIVSEFGFKMGILKCHTGFKVFTFETGIGYPIIFGVVIRKSFGTSAKEEFKVFARAFVSQTGFYPVVVGKIVKTSGGGLGVFRGKLFGVYVEYAAQGIASVQ